MLLAGGATLLNVQGRLSKSEPDVGQAHSGARVASAFVPFLRRSIAKRGIAWAWWGRRARRTPVPGIPTPNRLDWGPQALGETLGTD